MQTKLTLRIEDALVRKAKLLAKKRGTSVSRIFGDYISKQFEELPEETLPPVRPLCWVRFVNQARARMSLTISSTSKISIYESYA